MLPLMCLVEFMVGVRSQFYLVQFFRGSRNSCCIECSPSTMLFVAFQYFYSFCDRYLKVLKDYMGIEISKNQF